MNLALAPIPDLSPALQTTPEMHRIELYALRGDLPQRDRKIRCKPFLSRTVPPTRSRNLCWRLMASSWCPHIS
jgi:hypothetical protein